MEIRPIGVIHTPHTKQEGTPIQPTGAAGVKGTVEVLPEFAAGLRDLDGFSHIVLVYRFHRSDGYDLEVVPFLDTARRGLFATRAPRRPNALGLSVVALDRVDGCTLHIGGVDMLDGTPLLDIKPYVPAFDTPRDVRIGWLEGVDRSAHRQRADDRFT